MQSHSQTHRFYGDFIGHVGTGLGVRRTRSGARKISEILYRRAAAQLEQQNVPSFLPAAEKWAERRGRIRESVNGRVLPSCP